MKKKIFFLLGGAAMLTACYDDQDISSKTGNYQFTDKDLEVKEGNDFAERINKEKADLAEFVSEVRKEDPLVVDAYYSEIDGEKVINIVRLNEDPRVEDEDKSDFLTSYALPIGTGILYGMAGAALANAVMSPKVSSFNGNKEENKRKKSGSPIFASSAISSLQHSRSSYNNSKTASTQAYRSNAYKSSNYGKRQSAQRASLRSSKTAFSNKGSARSSSYGGSRGG